MAVISEDLAKGLTPEECAGIAKGVIVLPAGEFEWLPKGQRGATAPWQELSDRYSPEISAALSTARRPYHRHAAGMVAGGHSS